MDAPICGKIDDVVKSFWDNLKGLFGIIGIGTIIKEIITQTKGAKELFEKAIEFVGVEAAAGFWIWAIIVYAVSVYILFRMWYDDCVGDPEGQTRCVSGVVEKVTDESVGLIFNADHPSAHVVVKSRYWDLLQLNAGMINCSAAGSPILIVFYESSKVCGAKLGALIGGAAVGIGGIVLGALAAAAIGCATIILCALALLIAALIVVAAVIIGAAAGGAIGAAVSEDNVPELENGDAIQVGDYVSVLGPTIRNDNYEGAIVQYFNETTSLLGRSSGSPSFSHEDPDNAIPDNMEACPAIIL